MRAEALVVIVGDTRCAVPMERVIEVRVHEGARRVPGAPDWVCGIVEREGVPVEVFDAARRFGMSSSADRPCLLFFERAAMLVGDVDRLIERRPVDVDCTMQRDLVVEMIDDEGVGLPLIDVDAFFGHATGHAKEPA